MLDVSSVKMLCHYANECKNDKDSRGDDKHDTFAMMCYENSEEETNENGGEENNEKVDPGRCSHILVTFL